MSGLLLWVHFGPGTKPHWEGGDLVAATRSRRRRCSSGNGMFGKEVRNLRTDCPSPKKSSGAGLGWLGWARAADRVPGVPTASVLGGLERFRRGGLASRSSSVRGCTGGRVPLQCYQTRLGQHLLLPATGLQACSQEYLLNSSNFPAIIRISR